ncbi:MAG TPA: hypothetical protein VGP63_30415, partial [Planctomycetaceae bacterium]|nr:hypothetical protein [Planctomycetaceae bacterium]
MPQTRARSPKRRQYDGLAAALFAGSLVERVAITLGTGLLLFLMFLGYREAARGLRPGDRVGRPRVPRPVDSEASYHKEKEYESPADDDQGARKAKKYFPNTWVPSASHYMATSDMRTFCFFQEWTRESAHVVKFTPFAMISSRKGDKPDDPPYTVISDKAYVTFKDEFLGPTGKSPGPVLQAGLEGKVVIAGPHNLTIKGRNFFFEREEMRIYSDNLVEIHADKHTATAKGIQIELIAEQKSRSDESLAISGVSSVKLLQNVDMTLISAADGRGGPGALPGLSKTADKGPRIVRTHCDGSFVFYVESRIGTFERNVRIRRETAPNQFDALVADENVEIAFEQKKPGEAKPSIDPKKPPEAKSGAIAVGAD